MKDIAVVAYHQSDCVAQAGAANEVELIMPQLRAVFDQVGLNNAQDVDFVCSGSCDYLQGAALPLWRVWTRWARCRPSRNPMWKWTPPGPCMNRC